MTHSPSVHFFFFSSHNRGARKKKALSGDSPVFDVDISTILHGRAFNMTNPFLRKAEHCIGKVADAPASPVSKCVSSISVAIVD